MGKQIPGFEKFLEKLAKELCPYGDVTTSHTVRGTTVTVEASSDYDDADGFATSKAFFAIGEFLGTKTIDHVRRHLNGCETCSYGSETAITLVCQDCKVLDGSGGE